MKRLEAASVTTCMRWPGSKWRIADWIIAHFPDHGVYCEPFFGSGAVFFRKPPSGTETINDLDGNVVNLFRVIRDAADVLCPKIEMTPYARDEYRASYDLSKCDDAVERARRFLVRIWQDYGGKTYCSTAWSHSRVNGVFRPKYWSMVPDKIMGIVSRLKMAQIENLDALELIPLYNHRDVLLYLDPPYLRDTRTNLHYKCEFAKPEEHQKLLELCRGHKGPCVISCYDSPLYADELKDWTKKRIKTRTTHAHIATETIYMNPICDSEMNLFDISAL